MFLIMESYEYNEVIEKMTEQIQFLTIELACALYDLSGYMGDWQREEIRKLRTEDYLYRLSDDDAYQAYVMQELDGEDPLKEEAFTDEVMEYARSEETDLFYPSIYSRKELKRGF
jgi:hypothetical protein